METLIGSAKGKVAIHANEAAHLTSASILAGTDATVQAPEMVLDGKHNTADIKQTHEVKTSGLTVSFDLHPFSWTDIIKLLLGNEFGILPDSFLLI